MKSLAAPPPLMACARLLSSAGSRLSLLEVAGVS
jgi:hypothetical protein